MKVNFFLIDRNRQIKYLNNKNVCSILFNVGVNFVCGNNQEILINKSINAVLDK